MRFDFKFREVI